MNKQGTIDAIYALLAGSGTFTNAFGGTSTPVPAGLGVRTSRGAAADLTAATAIFTIAGGPIFLTGLLGIRTVIQGGGASNISFEHSNGPTVLSAATATSATDPVGQVYCLAGDNGDALVMSAGAGVANSFIPLDPGRLVATSLQYGGAPLRMLGIGNITVRLSAAAPTGSTRYVMFWIPVDALSTVVAA
jgi:hypothetical protein